MPPTDPYAGLYADPGRFGPRPSDDAVVEFLSAYREAAPAQREELRDGITEGEAVVLGRFAWRMTAEAVRQDSAEPLRHGILAMGIEYPKVPDRRDYLIGLAPLNFSAVTVGTTLTRLANEQRAYLPEPAYAEFLSFDRRDEQDKSLPAMGFAACGPREEFRFVSGPTTGNGWLGRKYW